LGLALARRATRLRAGFVVYTRNRIETAAGEEPAAFFLITERLELE
jgi:hypothetical protein